MNVKPEEERKTMRMKLKLNSKEYEKLKRYFEIGMKICDNWNKK